MQFQHTDTASNVVLPGSIGEASGHEHEQSQMKVQMVQEGRMQQLRKVMLKELGGKVYTDSLSDFMLALLTEDEAVVSAMRENGHTDIDHGFSLLTPLQNLARCGSMWAVQQLLLQGEEFSGPDNIPSRRDLECAAEGGSVQMLRDFIEARGFDASTPASRHCSILGEACKSGSVQCVKYLLRRGLHVPPNRNSRQILLRSFQHACNTGGLVMVKALLKAGWPADSAALSVAACAGNVPALKLLVKRGADVNAIASHCDHTPIMSLFISPPDEGLVEVLDELLAMGAMPNAVPGSGTPPLQLAYSAPIEAVERLIDAGALISGNAGGKQHTPMCAFALWDRIDLVRLLLAKGANAREQGKDGLTPMLCSAIMKNVAMMLLLLRHGAHLSESDNDGQTYEFWLSQTPEALTQVHHWRDSLRWRQLPLLHRRRTVLLREKCAGH